MRRSEVKSITEYKENPKKKIKSIQGESRSFPISSNDLSLIHIILYLKMKAHNCLFPPRGAAAQPICCGLGKLNIFLPPIQLLFSGVL